MKLLKILLCVAALVSTTAYAEESSMTSPNGKFTLKTNYTEDIHTLDLVNPAGETVRVYEEDSKSIYWRLLWAPSSDRFALMTRMGHPYQEISVYLLKDGEFKKADLPTIPESTVPDKIKRGKSYPHTSTSNWQEAIRWAKDGSLLMDVTTMIEGQGDDSPGSITARRKIVIRFDHDGKAKLILKPISYEIDKED